MLTYFKSAVMKRKLIESLGIKMNNEFELYRWRMLDLEPEEVFLSCYQIHIISSLKELILDRAESLPEEDLTRIIAIQDFLYYLYENWISNKYLESKSLEEFFDEIMKDIRSSDTYQRGDYQKVIGLY